MKLLLGFGADHTLADKMGNTALLLVSPQQPGPCSAFRCVSTVLIVWLSLPAVAADDTLPAIAGVRWLAFRDCRGAAQPQAWDGERASGGRGLHGLHAAALRSSGEHRQDTAPSGCRPWLPDKRRRDRPSYKTPINPPFHPLVLRELSGQTKARPSWSSTRRGAGVALPHSLRSGTPRRMPRRWPQRCGTHY